MEKEEKEEKEVELEKVEGEEEVEVKGWVVNWEGLVGQVDEGGEDEGRVEEEEKVGEGRERD